MRTQLHYISSVLSFIVMDPVSIFPEFLLSETVVKEYTFIMKMIVIIALGIRIRAHV